MLLIEDHEAVYAKDIQVGDVIVNDGKVHVVRNVENFLIQAPIGHRTLTLTMVRFDVGHDWYRFYPVDDRVQRLVPVGVVRAVIRDGDTATVEPRLTWRSPRSSRG